MSAAPLLLMACVLAAAETLPLKVTAEAPPPTNSPNNGSYTPCAGSTFEGDLFGHKAADCAGVTRVAFDPKLEAVSWKAGEDSPGKARMWIDEIRLQFSLKLEMAVSKHYPPGSCPYEATVAHENGHWNDALALQKEALAGLRADLAKAKLPLASRPAVVADKKKQDFADEKSAVVQKLFDKRRDEFLRKLGEANAKRDSPYRYRMVDLARCPRQQWKTQGP